MTYKATLLLIAGMTISVLIGTAGDWLFLGLLIVVALVRMGLR